MLCDFALAASGQHLSKMTRVSQAYLHLFHASCTLDKDARMKFVLGEVNGKSDVVEAGLLFTSVILVLCVP